MADIVYDLKATIRRNTPSVLGKGDAGNVKALDVTVNIPATAVAGDTVKICRIPSAARIGGLSEVAWDDLDDTTDLMLDFGFASVNSNITSDPDALTDGLDTSSAGTAKLIKDHANYGKRAWEFVNGQTSDPGGELDLYMTLTDHDVEKAGDITVSLLYTLD